MLAGRRLLRGAREGWRLARRTCASRSSQEVISASETVPQENRSSEERESSEKELVRPESSLERREAGGALSNEEILKIASVELVSKKEVAIMERQKKIMTVYAFAGLAVSLFGMSLGATVFMSI